MADHFPVPDRYTNGVHQCTKNVKYIGREPIAYTYMFGNASLGLYWRINFSHVHNIHSAKYQNHTMTSLYLQRGMFKVCAGGKDKSVCRPSNEESSTCPGTVVLIPARHLRSMRSPAPQPCTLGRWHGRLLAQTARCC